MNISHKKLDTTQFFLLLLPRKRKFLSKNYQIKITPPTKKEVLIKYYSSHEKGSSYQKNKSNLPRKRKFLSKKREACFADAIKSGSVVDQLRPAR
jgi:hypothetical protein